MKKLILLLTISSFLYSGTGTVSVNPVQPSTGYPAIEESAAPGNSQIIDKESYSVIPVSANYNEAIAEKADKNNCFYDVIETAEEFETYLKELNITSVYKIQLSAKYNGDFFKDNKLVLLLKHTSSTPKYAVNFLSKSENTLNIGLEETTTEMQLMDLVVKGFLIGVDNKTMENIDSVNIQYSRIVVDK